MKKSVLIHEIHDMWPATLIELGDMSPSHPFIRMLQFAENSAYKNSDKVVSILPNNEDYIREHGLKGDYICIPNGIVEADWANPTDLDTAHKYILEELKEQGKFIVGYFGGHALSNALDTLIDSAKVLMCDSNCSEVVIVMVGKGVEKNRLIERVRNEKIANVVFLDPIEKKSIPNLLSYFDCAYMGTTDSTLYRFGIGLNKLYDAMSVGIPIILSTNAQKTPVEIEKCGIVVPACDAHAVKKAVCEIKEMSSEERKKMSKNGIESIKKNYTYSILADRFLEAMECGNDKRILLINHYAGSPDMGMEFRPYYMAQEWIKKGYKVDIFAADFSHLRTRNPSISKSIEKEIIDGITYHWIHTSVYEGNGAKRALTMLKFVFVLLCNSKRIAKTIAPDAIIASSTYPLDTFAGQLIRYYTKKEK